MDGRRCESRAATDRCNMVVRCVSCGERWTWKVCPRKLKVKDERPRLLKLIRRVRIILVVVMGCYPYGSTPLVMRRVFLCVCVAGLMCSAPLNTCESMLDTEGSNLTKHIR